MADHLHMNVAGLREGDPVDAKDDKDGRWWRAVIMERPRMSAKDQMVVNVHFLGWTQQYDAWVDVDCNLAPRGRMTTRLEDLRPGLAVDLKSPGARTRCCRVVEVEKRAVTLKGWKYCGVVDFDADVDIAQASLSLYHLIRPGAHVSVRDPAHDPFVGVVLHVDQKASQVCIQALGDSARARVHDLASVVFYMV